MRTYQLPLLTDAEWRVISAAIPRNKAGPPPRHDRAIVSALCYAQVTNCSFESLPPGYPKPMSIRTRMQRWDRAGVLDQILEAAKPARDRIRFNYRERLYDLAPWGRDWKFGRAEDDPAFRNLPRMTHRIR